MSERTVLRVSSAMLLRGCAVLLGLAVCVGAGAQGRTAYKYVDEDGKVVYSQSPPPSGNSRSVDISPAGSGRPNSTPRTREDYNRSAGIKKDKDQSVALKQPPAPLPLKQPPPPLKTPPPPLKKSE